MKIEIEIPDNFDELESAYGKQLDAKISRPEEFLEIGEIYTHFATFWDIAGQSDYLLMLFRIHDMVEREYTKGKRCSVCGMTSDQAKAANYDCAREC